MSKKNFTLFIYIVILNACNHLETKTVDITYSDTTVITDGKPSSKAIEDYQSFVSKLDTTDVETTTVAAKKYQEIFKPEDAPTKDKGFIIFNKHYERIDININELHEKDTTDFDPLIAVDDSGKSLPVSPKLKAYNDRLKRNGFEVSSTEGMTYIKQERDLIAKWFYGYVSSTMKVYLQQLNKENKEGFQEDAGIIIEAKQYVDRLTWWDNFIKRNPKFILLDESKEHRKYMLTFFIIGMDNSSIISYVTNKIDDYYKTGYSYLQNNYPNSETNKIVSPYFKALLQNDKQKAAKIIIDYKKKGLIIDFREDDL